MFGRCQEHLVASMLLVVLVAMPGAPSSVLLPTCAVCLSTLNFAVALKKACLLALLLRPQVLRRRLMCMSTGRCFGV